MGTNRVSDHFAARKDAAVQKIRDSGFSLEIDLDAESDDRLHNYAVLDICKQGWTLGYWPVSSEEKPPPGLEKYAWGFVPCTLFDALDTGKN